MNSEDIRDAQAKLQTVEAGLRDFDYEKGHTAEMLHELMVSEMMLRRQLEMSIS